jgi:uncharacterized protein (TIGR03435 family)
MRITTFFRFGLTAVVFLCCALGQSDGLAPQPTSGFEAASVKASRSQYGNCKITPFRLNCTGFGLDTMVLRAYGQRPYLVKGLPPWASSAFYDINAVLEDQGSRAIGKQENLRLLMAGLQGLLEERFHLRFHHENQLRSGFRLVAAKGGLKLKSAANPSGSGFFTNSHRLVEYGNYTMARVAVVLSGDCKCPVVDVTRAEGHYDFELHPEPNEPQTNRSPLGAALGNFGLRLEAGKFETDILVIDRIEKLAGN